MANRGGIDLDRVAAFRQQQKVQQQAQLQQVVISTSQLIFSHLAASAIATRDGQMGPDGVSRERLVALAEQSKRAALYFCEGIGLGTVTEKAGGS